MFYRRNWIAVIAVILGLVMFIPVAQAQRQEIEARYCSVQVYNSLHYSPEVGITSYDQKGIWQSTHENKLLDNWTLQVVGVTKRMHGKMSWNGFSKEVAPDGEFIIWEFSGNSESGITTAKPIYGTGKWKDVKGERKSQAFTTAKPIAPIPNLTVATCTKATGWIELPK